MSGKLARRFSALLLALATTGLMLVGCGRDTTMLGQIQPDQTVYADLWDEDADEVIRPWLSRSLLACG